MPDRPKFIVLGPDDPKKSLLGFSVFERNGTTVRKPGSSEALLRLEDIQPGDELLVLMFTGKVLMTAVLVDGVLWAESGRTLANLEYDKDDRHCWVSTYATLR